MILLERELWFLLDVIATRESAMGGNHAKSVTAVEMMRHLEKPTPEECRSMYLGGYDVTGYPKKAA